MKLRGKIVYVDDDREDHELFRLALAEICECDVVSAFDGEEAFGLIDKHKNEIFCIISDIQMPKITGLELKRMIENSPLLKLKAIPFIYHTSVNDPVIVKEAYALGIQGYMLKNPDFKATMQNLDHFIRFWQSTMHPTYVMPVIRF